MTMSWVKAQLDYVAAALAKEFNAEIPLIEKELGGFLASMLPPLPPDAAQKVGAHAAMVANKAAAEWEDKNEGDPNA